ncbi:hypothetical protein [Aneurinibacillus aneurinilyticus]|uniref:Uncharacterized protein n=1 Tax=Aneurinibacillus aneurinilyticus TaxID=1391 RepID=A0A848D6H6_ANEAE|nr:hypothetical protein [Aneurinibacillus aneurinilyticus]NMF01391.1 hypothetical protein [Aneurinibacillus aneurinilyticus]
MDEYLDKLTEEREGYIMRNEQTNVEIKCTEEFVEAWKQRGFVIVSKGKIRLMDK